MPPLGETERCHIFSSDELTGRDKSMNGTDTVLPRF